MGKLVKGKGERGKGKGESGRGENGKGKKSSYGQVRPVKRKDNKQEFRRKDTREGELCSSLYVNNNFIGHHCYILMDDVCILYCVTVLSKE